MRAWLIVVVVVSWWANGFMGFVYWWTKDNDLMPSHLLMGAIVGTAGPLTWAAGYLIHGDHPVLIHKRGDRP